MSKHYIGEVGTELRIDTGVLIGSATIQHIKYRKPDGVTEGTFTASLFSSYSELAEATNTYYLSRTIESTDFNTPGEWRIQAVIGTISGTWIGEMVKLNIFDEYE